MRAPREAEDSSPEFMVISGMPAAIASLMACPKASGSGKETTKPSGWVAAAAAMDFAMSAISPDGVKIYSKSAPIALAASSPPF